jgi:hypothetical protein
MALPPDPNALGDAWGFGKGLVSGVGDGIKSAAEGVADLAKGGYALATDEAAREKAWQTAKQLASAGQDYAGRAYNDPSQAFTDAKDGANRMLSAFEKARDAAAARGESAEFWGQAVGRVGFEVGAMLVPVGAATKLGKLAEGAKTADQLVDGIRAADKLAEGGAAVAKAEAAVARAAAATDAGYEVLPCGKVASAAAKSLSQDVIDNIKAMAKGTRPDPSTYMPAEQIAEQLAEFENGASRLMTKSNLDKYGPGQIDGTSFIKTRASVDELLKAADGDIRKLEEALGLPAGQLDGQELIRVDFPAPKDLGLRIPSGNEAGANALWIPGGKLPDNSLEAVIDIGSAKPGDIVHIPVGVRK